MSSPCNAYRASLVSSYASKLCKLLTLVLNQLSQYPLISQILSTSSGRYQMEISDLNRIFGSALFDGIKMNQSLTLLVYLINNQQDIFL